MGVQSDTGPAPAGIPSQGTAFVQFWNGILGPKFIRFKHVFVDRLTQHREAVFPSLPVNEGDRMLDVAPATVE